MILGLFLGIFLVTLNYCTAFHVQRGGPNGQPEGYAVTPFAYQTALCLFSAGALCAVAALLPSFWLSVAFVWIAFSIPITSIAWGHRWVPQVASAAHQSTAQMVLTAAGALYVGLSRLLVPSRDLPLFAAALCCWGLLNTWAAWYQRGHNHRLPKHFHFNFKRSVEGGPALGLTDNGSELAWLLAVSTLSAGYLALRWHPVVALLMPLFLWGLYHAANNSAMGACGVGILGGLWGLWPLMAGVLLALLAPLGVLGFLRKIGQNSWDLRKLEWKRALDMIRASHSLGFGPGVWENHQIIIHPTGGPQHVWTALHNDWLQSVVEVGVLPTVCGLGYLVAQAVGLRSGNEQAYAFALLTFTASFGLLYYPTKVPSQALVLLVAMGALGT